MKVFKGVLVLWPVILRGVGGATTFLLNVTATWSGDASLLGEAACLCDCRPHSRRMVAYHVGRMGRLILARLPNDARPGIGLRAQGRAARGREGQLWASPLFCWLKKAKLWRSSARLDPSSALFNRRGFPANLRGLAVKARASLPAPRQMFPTGAGLMIRLGP